MELRRLTARHSELNIVRSTTIAGMSSRFFTLLGSRMPRLVTDKMLLGAIDAICCAGTDASSWSVVADICRRLIPGSSFTLLVNSDKEGGHPIPFSSGWDPHFLRSYAEYYHAINPYQGMLKNFAAGVVVKAGDIVDPKWQRRNQFFNEWLKPAGNFTGGASVKLEDRNSYMRLAYDLPDAQRKHEPDTAAVLSRLRPHFERSLQLNGYLDQTESARALEESVLDSIHDAAFVVNRHGFIHAQNTNATATMHRGSVVKSLGGKLAFFQTESIDTFSTGLKQLFSGAIDTGPIVWRTGPGRRFRILMLPLTLSRNPPRCLVLISDLHEKPLLPTDVLRLAFDLTPAEGRAVAMITEGLSLAEIAHNLRLSRATVRNQLSAAMRKMGVRRQSEIVSLILDLQPRLDLRRRLK